jgi:RNA polymerase sigma factor (sigma-70 family)
VVLFFGSLGVQITSHYGVETMQGKLDMASATLALAQQVATLLSGDELARGEAIYLIDKELRHAIVKKIRHSAPSLAPQSVAEAYQDTLLSVWQIARAGHFNPEKPLLPLLFAVAQRRAVDCLRKRCRREVDYDQLLNVVSSRLKDTNTGEAWHALAQRETARKTMHALRDVVAHLPPRQREVASIIVDAFPDVLSVEEMRQAVAEETGRQVTLAAVKRAWQEARKKTRRCLVQPLGKS